MEIKNCKKLFQTVFALMILILFSFYFTPVAHAGWNLTFSDEFNGSSLDTTKWSTCYPPDLGGGTIQICTNNPGLELECYEAANVTEGNGLLTLTAQTQSISSCYEGGGTYGSYNYSSGMISSYGMFSQLYGYFEARMQLLDGAMYWPAFWLIPANNTWPPEIDIMEDYVGLPTIYQNWFSQTTGEETVLSYTSPVDLGAGLHVYASDWEPGSITYYVDGVQTNQVTNSNVPNIPMFIIANLALHNSGGFVSGSSVYIDYIRVYTKVSNGGCYATIPGPNDPIPSMLCSGSQNQLTVTEAGTGSGTVTVNPGTLNWIGNIGTASYSSGTSVALTATPSFGGSIFAGWSGDPDCTDGIVILSADKDCTATFNLCNSASIAMTDSSDPFGSITAAYVGAASTDTIKIIAANQQEDLVFSGKNLTLQGGYDCAFTEPPTSFTTITGSLTIAGGCSVSIGGIRIR